MFHRPRPEERPEENESDKRAPEQQKSAEMQQPAQVVEQAAAAQKQEITPAKEEKVMKYDQSENQEKEEQSMEAPAGVPFQRPPQMQRSAPGFAAGYPGSHGYEAGNKAERRLVIGQGITMSGEIEACDYLLVEGTLEAALKGAKVLEIASTGTFYGAVEIEEATVAGRFEGELTVKGAGGRVS